MTSNLIWIYLWNVVINSLLMFFTLTILIEVLLGIFCIKNDRLKVYCRCIPILKLPIDLFLYDFSKWALGEGINPLFCEPGTRLLTAKLCCPSYPCFITTGIQFFFQDGKTFSFADLVVLNIGELWIKGFVVIIMITTGVIIITRSLSFWRSWNTIKVICQRARISLSPIYNPKIVQSKVKVLISNEIDVPFATFNTIVLPEALMNQLCQEEYEAILAHELEHVRWKDSWMKMLLELIRMIFWWAPIRLLLHRMEYAQERACDFATTNYGVSHLDLASAITKTMRMTSSSLETPLTSCFVKKKAGLKRLEALLKPPQHSRPLLSTLQLLFFGLLMGTILFGKFWIF